MLLATVATSLTVYLMTTPSHAQVEAEPLDKIESKLGNLRSEFKKLRKGGRKDWHYGTYVDIGYLWDFNERDADLWRSKSTTFRLNSLEANNVMGYVRKDVNPTASRWGFDFGLQTGVDTEGLVPEASDEPLAAADTLRHFYRANGSYLLPVGNGVKLTAGLFNSYIGYTSFHAKDNANYTRGYVLDNVPYFLFGAEAIYPASDTVTLGLYVVNGYEYLAEPNNAPSYGLHTVWEATPNLTFAQNLYYGPDQPNTDLQFWRLLSDTILEWKESWGSIAVAYDIGTEKQAADPGNPRFFWMAGAVWTRWEFQEPWSLGLRPEFYWDPDGLITGAKQLIWAITGTVEYRLGFFSSHNVIAKLEYRFDRSTGSGGGFFTGQELPGGIPLLTPNQQLLIFGLMWAFESGPS